MLLGLVYFIIFFIPNASTMDSDNALVYLDRDEYVTYPIVERMLAFEGDIHSIWGSLIIYGDYHYGYPFYFLSMLVLLPFRLIWGAGFSSHTAFNILMLRQFINVLPMLLTAGIFSYIQTHFKSIWKSILIFAILLTIPAVVRSNLHWWHPDSLMMLAIALTFLFLDLDDFRLKKYFYFSAAACGMAAAIKLMGLFFFLTIPVYLLMAWKKNSLQIKIVVKAAVRFILVMTAVILISNPFVFYEAPRQDMLDTQIFKTQELTEGYSHEDSIYYNTGPQYWQWTLKVSYGRAWAMVFLAVSFLFGCWYNPRRQTHWLLVAWSLPLFIYLMWFVSPKPDHYLLPLMLPVFSSISNLVYPFEQCWHSEKRWVRYLSILGVLLFSITLFTQLEYQVSKCLENFLSYLIY